MNFEEIEKAKLHKLTPGANHPVCESNLQLQPYIFNHNSRDQYGVHPHKRPITGMYLFDLKNCFLLLMVFKLPPTRSACEPYRNVQAVGNSDPRLMLAVDDLSSLLTR